MLNAFAKQVVFLFHTIGPTSEKRYLAFGHQFVCLLPLLLLPCIAFILVLNVLVLKQETGNQQKMTSVSRLELLGI